MANRTVSVRLLLELAGADKVRDGAKSVRDLGDELKNAKKDNLDKIAVAAGGMGAALGGAFAYVVKSAADFDRQMSMVAAVSGETGKGLSDLRNAAVQAGKDTQYSATEAAKAESELAKAGISTADILGGGLSGSLALAAAGQLDLADAATVTAKTMNAFKLSGKDVPHIADVLAASANKSATDVGEMGQALQQSAMVASQFGVSLEDTAGALSAFADRGLAGSDAGTSLKTMLLALANPAEKTAQQMEDLGINAYDAQGRFVGLAGLAQELKDKLGGLTDQQRQAALAQIFGSDAVRAATVLYDLGADGVKKYSDAVNQSGAAADVARKQTDNLAGDIERLQGSLETLAIEAGSGTNSGLRSLVKLLDELVTAFGSIPGPVQTALVVLAGVGGGGLLGLAGWLKLRTAVLDAVAALRATGPAGERAATGLGKAGMWAGRAATAFIALQVAGEIFEQFRDAAPNIDRLADSLAHLGKTGESTSEAARVLGGNLKGFKVDAAAAADNGFLGRFERGLESAIPPLREFNRELGGSWKDSQENIQAVDQALTQLVQGGQLEEARAAFTRLLQSSSLSYDELTQILPSYTDAIKQAEQSTSASGQAQKAAAEKAELLSGGMQKAAESGKSVKDMFDALNGAALGWGNAEIGAEAAIDALSESLKENGRSMDVNTEKGRANKSALLDGVDAAAKAMQAKYDDAVAAGRQSTALEEARATYGQYIKRLEDTLVQSGMTRESAHKLVEEYGKVPPLVATNVQANGLNGAINQVQELNRYLVNLNGKTVTTTVRVVGSRAGPVASVNRWGGLYEPAAVGTLREAELYSTASPGRYMIAEPQTGGEAFVPRYGDYGRSMSILQHAARWYGAQVVPQGTVAGSGGEVHYHLHDSRATIGQLEALQRRQEISARVGRPG